MDGPLNKQGRQSVQFNGDAQAMSMRTASVILSR